MRSSAASAMRALKVLFLTACTVLLGPLQAHARGPCSAIAPDPAVWRTNLAYEGDPLFVTSAYNANEPRWVKFTILLCDPTTVYFHNGGVYRFHYDFARARLQPFLNATPAQFDAATLHASGQQAVLGAVLIPGFGLFGETNPAREMAIQLVRQDAYSREEVRTYINLVRSRLTGSSVPTFYFPTFEQQPSAEANRAWLSQNGIEVSGPQRWIRSNTSYSQGWAIGTLKFVTGAQIGAAYRAGQLRPEDILLTDGVPAEVPPVAGIISLVPATPSSHIALLSQTWGIPFVYLSGADGVAVQGLIGRRVLLRGYVVQGVSNAAVVDSQSLDAALVDQLLAMKAIPALQYDPLELRGTYFSGVDALTPADTPRVGGKAANYGLLRRAIPASVRPAAALGFDLWNQFLAQPMFGGRTLRQTIEARLAGLDTWPPANPAAQAQALGEIRNMFTSTSTTRFTAAQEAEILTSLQSSAFGFDPDVKIRFRSSTNVEDTAVFTGAGLYDSFSGCLRDDLDADAAGPSACDPAEPSERGVLRAIRRVFASFYNDNAYQARRRLRVNEAQVGMAMLVHHSFPDSTELANGVAILSQAGPGSSIEISIVSQLGAISVTNPADGSTPEEVDVFVLGSNAYPELRRSSSRAMLGQTVMTWETDYRILSGLLTTVAGRYVAENGITGAYALDFEFKKTTVSDGPGGIEIKQVRPLPVPSGSPSLTPVLINRPQQYCLFQGETSTVLSNHRLKMDLLLNTESQVLTPSNLNGGILADASVRLTTGCRIRSLAGAASTWPGFSWSLINEGAGKTGTFRWRITDTDNPRTYSLSIENIPASVSASQSPIVWLNDFGSGQRRLIRLHAAYDRPVPNVDWTNTIIPTFSDDALLGPCPDPAGLPVHRVFSIGPYSIDTRFFWVPGGAAAGYTFDLASWDRTIINGLASRPITLRGSWSQTYRPGHHNFTEDYIFDPRLEPGMPPAILQELAQRGISYLLILDVGTLSARAIPMSDGCMPCPADWDQSGGVGIGDIFRFLAAWFTMDPQADWDGSGVVAVQDLFEFLAAYFVGCPPS